MNDAMKKTSVSYKTKAKLLMIPGLVGFALFYLVPLFWSLYYALIDNNFKQTFVGLRHFENLFANEFFVRALVNTLCFSAVSVVLIIAFSLVISVMFLYAGKRTRFLRSLFLLPMLLPTAAVAFLWRNLFNASGALTAVSLADTSLWAIVFSWQAMPLYIIFLWKYSGFIIILLSGAILSVEKEIYQAAALDGAGGFRLHRYITLPMIRPTLFFSCVLTAVNGFSIYKEVYYLFGGDYPPDAVYLLQHFMNNHFRRLNYPVLSASAWMFVVILLAAVFVFYRLDNKKSLS